MRTLAICSALLLSSCGTYTSVVGPYRASISRADVDSIKRLSQKFLADHGGDGSSNTLTLNAVKSDEVWVYTVSQGNTFYIDFVAICRGGIWTLSKAARSPAPPFDDGTFPRP
ncbi:MAG: hypothetical protein ACREIF_01930 [Chthoniobacterales bacterium]